LEQRTWKIELEYDAGYQPRKKCKGGGWSDGDERRQGFIEAKLEPDKSEGWGWYNLNRLPHPLFGTIPAEIIGTNNIMDEENKDNILSRLEALLFIHGEPMDFKKIAQVLKIQEADVAKAVQLYRKNLEDTARGLSLIEHDGRVQLATKIEHSGILEEFMKDELKGDLTPASVETLAVILYFGPVPRSRIDYLRGVNSSFILRNLLLRGLVERLPDPRRLSQYLYSPSSNTLRHLGVSSRENLPEFKAIHEKLEKIKQEEKGENPRLAEVSPLHDIQ
jgi:segregation and condensation protein B